MDHPGPAIPAQDVGEWGLPTGPTQEKNNELRAAQADENLSSIPLQLYWPGLVPDDVPNATWHGLSSMRSSQQDKQLHTLAHRMT